MPVVLAAETLEVFSEPEQRNGGGAMTSDVLLVAWHGVEGDPGTWWATTGPLSENALPNINPNHHFQANSFAGPAIDPSAGLVALVGAAFPSPITLHSVNSNAEISGPVPPLLPTRGRGPEMAAGPAAAGR